MSKPRLTLVSHHLCPYVQRAAIALAEKGVAFERITIDLSAKPDWFLAISPLGKVPLLIVREADGGEAVLFESSVICEYIEETQPGPRLHPAEALERARHRGWIEFCSAVLNAIWRFYSASDEAAFEKERAGLGEMFDKLEAELGDGPFFTGEGFSLVDAVVRTRVPVFRRVRQARRHRRPRRQAEDRGMAQEPRSSGVGARRGHRGFRRAADALP